MLSDTKIAEVMQAYVDRITAGDLEGILDLFTEDAVVEDPVGSEPARGREALRAFYQVAVDSVEKMELEGNVRARERWGACAMLAYPKGMDMSFVIETLDVMEFDQDGKITAMTAYFGDTNMRAV